MVQNTTKSNMPISTHSNNTKIRSTLFKIDLKKKFCELLKIRKSAELISEYVKNLTTIRNLYVVLDQITSV